MLRTTLDKNERQRPEWAGVGGLSSVTSILSNIFVSRVGTKIWDEQYRNNQPTQHHSINTQSINNHQSGNTIPWVTQRTCARSNSGHADDAEHPDLVMPVSIHYFFSFSFFFLDLSRKRLLYIRSRNSTENAILLKQVTGAKAAFKAADKPMPPLRYKCVNRIPYARGMGSSSAAIIAGLIGGLVLAGHRLPMWGAEELLQLACEIEVGARRFCLSVGGLLVVLFRQSSRTCQYIVSVLFDVNSCVC